MSPIARVHAAPPIFNDDIGVPAFLIDALVFPGSSGSPAVLFDRGSYTLQNETTHFGSRMLLGEAMHTRLVNGVIEMVGRVKRASRSERVSRRPSVRLARRDH